MAVAQLAHRADETILKRAQNNPLQSTPKLLSDCRGRGGEVVRGRGRKSERRIQQSFSSELRIRLGIVFSQLADHPAQDRT